MKVKRGPNFHKTMFFIDSHQTRVSRRFLTNLTKFDPKSTWGGPKNLNFDLAVRTGWNQCHCEDYRIFVPTTVHGLKSELEQPRYHENWDDALIDALQTSESHNFWSDRWIFKFHTFSELGSQDLSRGTHIHTFWGRAAASKFAPKAINSLRHAPDQGDHFSGFLLFAWMISELFFPLLQTQKIHKNTSKSLDSSLFTKNIRYCSYTRSSSPWFYIMDLGFRSVNVTF